MINRITNANAYLNGASLIGNIEQIDLPNIKLTTEDTKALGMFATIELPSGLDKMESKIKWNAFYPSALKAENPLKSISITVKSNMVTHEAGGVTKNTPVTVTITGVFKEFPFGSIKGQEKIDGLEHVMTVYYAKLEIAGAAVYEVDVFNNILKIDSVDILENFRLNQ